MAHYQHVYKLPGGTLTFETQRSELKIRSFEQQTISMTQAMMGQVTVRFGVNLTKRPESSPSKEYRTESLGDSFVNRDNWVKN